MTMRASTTRVLAGVLAAGLFSPVAVLAQACPPELAEAQEKLETVRSLIRTRPFAGDASPPRSLAGRQVITDTPRGADSTEAPRGDTARQVPRSETPGQAPRDESVPAPRAAAGARTEDTARTRLERARQLTDESAAACRAGNMPLSSEKAKAALEALD